MRPVLSIPERLEARGLRSRYERVVNAVRKRLQQEMEKDSTLAIFALVEETRDRLVRSRDIESQWQLLLYPRRGDIWPEEFDRFAVASARRSEWQSVLEGLRRSLEPLQSLSNDTSSLTEALP